MSVSTNSGQDHDYGGYLNPCGASNPPINSGDTLITEKNRNETRPVNANVNWIIRVR